MLGQREHGQSTGRGVEKPDLNVAVVPALDSAGFFVALNEHLFAKQGLNVPSSPPSAATR